MEYSYNFFFLVRAVASTFKSTESVLDLVRVNFRLYFGNVHSFLGNRGLWMISYFSTLKIILNARLTII